MAEYADTGYSRPIMFGEFGCNEGENTIDGYSNQRSFYDVRCSSSMSVVFESLSNPLLPRQAKWMNEEQEMTDEIVGGNVFEFTTEIANLKTSKSMS